MRLILMKPVRSTNLSRFLPASTCTAKAFKRVSDAYTTLMDACARAEYDANLDGGGPGEEGPEDTNDIAVVNAADMPSGPPGLKKRKARPTRPARR